MQMMCASMVLLVTMDIYGLSMDIYGPSMEIHGLSMVQGWKSMV
jgi:hypothetical protein